MSTDSRANGTEVVPPPDHHTIVGAIPFRERTRFERAFGHGFSHVRVHDDSAAHAAAAALDADAYTCGHDIWFAAGRYAPGTTAGDRVLAHELTHVVQLDQGRISTTANTTPVEAGDPAESEAYAQESAVLARLPSSSTLAPFETETPTAFAPKRRVTTTRIHRRAPAEATETPDTGEAVESSEPPVPALEQLVVDFRTHDRAVAADLIQKLAASEPLEEAVALLDDEALLDVVFRELGADAWREPARAAMLAVLAVRSPEANAATIAQQLSTGLAETDLRVSGEEARLVYEILHAMAPEDRAAFLATPEGEQAFEKLPDRKRPGVRLSKELEFLEEDLEALLAELDVLENWMPENEPWLRTLFWMIVRSGHAGDPRVTAYVTDNWDTHGDFFAEQGLRADGELTMQRLRDTPRPRTLTFTGALLAVNSDLLGTVGVGLRWLTDSWGKKARVIENIPLEDLQKTLGGTLFGIRLDGFEGTPVSGKLTVGINPKEGELSITVPSAGIPTLSWGGEGLQGPISVTGRDVTLTGLNVTSRWPAGKTFADQDALHAHVDSLEVGQIVTTSGREETGRITALAVEDIELDIDLGPFREGDGTHLFRTVRHLESQLDSLMSALHAMVGSLVSTFTPPPSAAAALDLPAAFVAELKRALKEKLGGELLITASVGNLRAGDAALPGAGSTTVDTGFELIVAAGPRAVAELEASRLRARAEISELSPEDNIRLAELEVAAANRDREAADSVLRGLGFEPDNVVLQLTTQAAPDEPGLQLTGIDLPIAQTQLREATAQSAELIITFPAAAATKTPTGTTPDATSTEGVPLYRIDLDVTEGAAPAGAATELLGHPASAGPLSFAGMEGHADVFPDRRVQLDVVLRDVACEKMAWGIAIDAPGGRAATVHVTGTVQLTEAGSFVVADDAALTFDIDELKADRITIEKPGKFRAVAESPILTGLHVVLAEGELPAVHVESGTIAGFDGGVGVALNASSGQPLAFRDFDLTAHIDLGIYRFSFAELETRKVDLDVAGRRLAVTYFEGAIEGIVTDQLSGSVSIRPEGDLVLGALSVHLNALSEKFGPVDLGWKSVKLHGSRLDLTWAFLSMPSTESREETETTMLGVTLSGLHATSATATGLRLATQLAGAPIALSMDAQGEATIFGLDIPSMELLIARDFITAEGTISGDSLIAQGLVAKLGAALELQFGVSSNQLRFDALGDGGKPFRLDDLVVDGTAVVLSDGQPLRSWLVHLDADVAGELDREGVQVELDQPLVAIEGETVDLTKIEAQATKDSVAVTLEGGRYLGNHIEVKFDGLTANVVLGQPGDTPAALGNLQLNQSAKVGAYPILKFTGIQLKDASFEIDDLGALIGTGELFQMFPSLAELADHTNGTAAFRILVKDTFPNANVSTTVSNGRLAGTLTPDKGIVVFFEGDLLPSLSQNANQTEMRLFHAVGSRGKGWFKIYETIDVQLPVPDPLAIPLDVLPKDPKVTIVGLENIDIKLQVTPTNVLIPGAGELHLEAGSKVNLGVTGSTATGAAVTLRVDPTSARALLWDMLDFAAAGVRIDQGVNIQVEFSGLTVKKVKGTIATGSIDTATLGVIGK